MASYKAFKKRQENASHYANNANCRKCKYGEWVRTSAFCSGFGKPKKIRYANWDTEKNGYCTRFMPREISQVANSRYYAITDDVCGNVS